VIHLSLSVSGFIKMSLLLDKVELMLYQSKESDLRMTSKIRHDWKATRGRKLLSREQEIQGMKDLIDELKSENCNRVADLVAEELQDMLNE
jgi:hypothetical protein